MVGLVRCNWPLAPGLWGIQTPLRFGEDALPGTAGYNPPHALLSRDQRPPAAEILRPGCRTVWPALGGVQPDPTLEPCDLLAASLDAGFSHRHSRTGR